MWSFFLNFGIHVGIMFEICVEKGSELEPNDPQRKYKGRVVFRGNQVIDENNDIAFNIVDLKPPNIEELAEVITFVEYHPKRSDIFLFSSSRGYISICDLRVSSVYNNCAMKYMIEEDPSRKHFFTDIINSISKAKFSPIDDNYIFSRDYLSI